MRSCNGYQFNNAYLYITEHCQLHCIHCYLGKRLSQPTHNNLEMLKFQILGIKKLGIKKLCLLGGEPTLHPYFNEVVQFSKELNFDELIVDTNGLRSSLKKILALNPTDLSYVQISLDGGSRVIHDRIRGEGTFEQTCDSIKSLSSKGFKLKIVCTVNKVNYTDCLNIIPFAEDLGVSIIKYHIFSAIGNGCLNKELELSPIEWINFSKKILDQKGRNKIKIQFQPTYADQNLGRFYASQGYDGCIGRKLDRISIFPNCTSYICSFLFDTDANFAKLKGAKIYPSTKNNERDLFNKK